MDKKDFMKTSWFQRASYPKNPTTINPHQDPHTLLTASYDLEDGTIVLVPKLRMIEGKLEFVDDPVDYALKEGDFLTGFKTHNEATEFSRMISTLVGAERNQNKRIK